MSHRKFKKGDTITHKKESWIVPPREIRKVIKDGYDAPYVTSDGDLPRFLSSYQSRNYEILRIP